MTKPIHIDGAQGEGGGQVLRTCLTLSLVLQKTFRITDIRANRSKPGLMRQHLTCVNACAEISGAKVEGNDIGSTEVHFQPGKIQPGEYTFNIGTAGSTTLLFQTIFPALAHAGAASTITLEGGTHADHSPPVEFILRTYLPQATKMGYASEFRLERLGLFPSGGGKLEATIHPLDNPIPYELLEKGKILSRRATCLLVHLPHTIAQREFKVLQDKLQLENDELSILDGSSRSKGNALSLTIETPNLTETFSYNGRVGVSSEKVANYVVKEARWWLESDAPVGRHLADQLLLPLLLAKGGRFRTGNLTLHTRTNIDVLRQFSGAGITVEEVDRNVWEIEVPALK